MLSDYKEIITMLCDKFQNVISPMDIIKWLENFEETDWKKALTVLTHFEYFSIDDIIKEYSYGMEKIIQEKKYADEKFYLVPVGEQGKSGSAMLYFLKKSIEFINKQDFIIIVNNIEKNIIEKKENLSNFIIVLVDDFSGTGHTIKEFYKKFIPPQFKNCPIVALTVAYMEKAQYLLKKEEIQIYGNKRMPAFSQRGSVFGYPPRMEVIRSFCFEYGDKLYSKSNYDKEKKGNHPLGFMNSQSLIGFEHSIPNNTLPIIWADKKRSDKKQKWIPLFPRRGNLIIERSKKRKQEQGRWASIAHKLEINLTEENINIYGKDSIRLLSMIRLKQKHKNIFSICQELGINLNEYDDIIKRGVEKGFFNEKENLTEYATNMCNDISRKDKFIENKLRSELIIQENLLYVPKTFRGSS
jgi:hypothetical protein